MAATNFSQSGGELRIQDGGAYKVSHVGKTAWVDLMDFHGDTIHAKMQLKDRYLKCPVVLNGRGPSCMRPSLRLRDLGPTAG